MKHHILSAAMVATLVSGTAWAGAEWSGVTTANFLSVGSGAAILGRGGATLGLGGDAASVAWNTGALGWMRQTEIGFSHASLDGGINQEHVAVAGRLNRGPFFWGLSGLYQGQGGFEGRNASNQSTGTFNISSAAFSGQGAYRFRDLVSVGVGVKYVTENLGTVTGTGLAFDGGFLARFGQIGLGASATNRHGIMTYDDAKFGMPANFGVGASWHDPVRGLTLALDANFPNTYYSNVRTGVEWRWKEMVALRAGYRMEMDAPSDEALTGPTFGMGAGFGAFWADYGYVISGAEGAEGQHRISLSLIPSQWGSSGGYGQGGAIPPADLPAPKPVTPKTETVKTPPATKVIEPATKPAPVETKKAPASIEPQKVETPKTSTPAKAVTETSVAPKNAPAKAAATTTTTATTAKAAATTPEKTPKDEPAVTTKSAKAEETVKPEAEKEPSAKDKSSKKQKKTEVAQPKKKGKEDPWEKAVKEAERKAEKATGRK
jgi:hypothetical protein